MTAAQAQFVRRLIAEGGGFALTITANRVGGWRTSWATIDRCLDAGWIAYTNRRYAATSAGRQALTEHEQWKERGKHA